MQIEEIKNPKKEISIVADPQKGEVECLVDGVERSRNSIQNVNWKVIIPRKDSFNNAIELVAKMKLAHNTDSHFKITIGNMIATDQKKKVLDSVIIPLSDDMEFEVRDNGRLYLILIPGLIELYIDSLSATIPYDFRNHFTTSHIVNFSSGAIYEKRAYTRIGELNNQFTKARHDFNKRLKDVLPNNKITWKTEIWKEHSTFLFSEASIQAVVEWKVV